MNFCRPDFPSAAAIPADRSLRAQAGFDTRSSFPPEGDSANKADIRGVEGYASAPRSMFATVRLPMRNSPPS